MNLIPESSGKNMHTFIVSDEDKGLRLDLYLAGQFDDASRSMIQKAIKAGDVAINGQIAKRPSRTVNVGDSIIVDLPPPPSADLTPENIPLEILYQDSDLVVVNKPSGLVVHPAPGHYSGTLLNALIHHCPDFQRPGDDPIRPGVVHRLDRYTSGVMVVAKSVRGFAGLAQQARDHEFERRYLALVRGEIREEAGIVNAAIGRSLSDGARMSVSGIRGRDAVTRFRVLERLHVASLVALELETGRTHQIRVHMRYTGHPVIGDPVYGVTDFSSWNVPADVRAALEALEGQALHAELLGFIHPATGERMDFSAPPPPDFVRALDALRSLDA